MGYKVSRWFTGDPFSSFTIRRKNAMTEQQEGQTKVSRRQVLIGLGAGATGLVAGGVVGREVLAKPAPEEIAIGVPDTWVGRNFADCTGCRHCEIACSKYHEGVIWPGASRIRVYEYPPSVEFPVLCYQCADAPCARACPADALSVNEETKTIAIDAEKCLRISEGSDCTVCVDECPGNTIRIHPTENVPMFCDLCGGDPECVKVCPNATVTLNGVRAAVALPDDIAAGLAKAYEVSQDPEAAPPEMQGLIDVDRMFT
jgi:Fe-S-cluster-containing hydrogenase component 2